MRICLILEGSYPYTYGGVSSWTQQYIEQMPEHEFVLWLVNASAEQKGRFVYPLPKNVVGVYEISMDDAVRMSGRAGRRYRFTEEERTALRELISCRNPDWPVIFSRIQSGKWKTGDLLMSESFLDIITGLYEEQYPYAAFADTFHMIRSMLLPVFYICGQTVPRADVYHTICTGYAGILGALGHERTGKPLIITEHGIYTREREEEIIRSELVNPAFKRQWIRFFYMLSDAAYKRASAVTNLFHRAGKMQAELGADPAKIRTIPNGIDYRKFSAVPMKAADGYIDAGAVIRLAPIKDVITLIYAFYEASRKMPNLRLHILGGTDDEEYAQECFDLKESLHLDRLIFTGRVDSSEYMRRLDFTVLSSLSEGQPLSVLESLAAGRPCVTTDVGCCRELLLGEAGDSYGQAGFLVTPMDRQALADALLRMAGDTGRRRRFGQNGRRRVGAFYREEIMMKRYKDLYREVCGTWRESDLN